MKHCFNCRQSKAKLPRERPMFCTQRCAAEYAYELLALSEDFVFCYDHNEWGTENNHEDCNKIDRRN